KGLQVKKDGMGIPGVEAERGHGRHGFLTIGIDPCGQELDHRLLAPLAGQPAPRDVGSLIRPVVGFLLGADREGRTSEQPRLVGPSPVVLRGVTVATHARRADKVFAVPDQIRRILTAFCLRPGLLARPNVPYAGRSYYDKADRKTS